MTSEEDLFDDLDVTYEGQTSDSSQSPIDLAYLPPDWGALNQSYGPVILLRFYIVEQQPKAQIGCHRNIALCEVAAVFTNMSRKRTYVNVVIQFDTCKEPHFHEFKTALSRLCIALRFQCPAVERCVLYMDDYTKAKQLEFLSENLDRLFELNIGTPHDNWDVDICAEVDPVSNLVHIWALACKNTLRCLRVYPAFSLCPVIAATLRECAQLKHITVSKIRYVDEFWEIPSISSLEWDGRSLAYIDTDLIMARHILRHFPTCRTFRCHRLTWDITLRMLNHFVKGGSGKAFNVYATGWSLEKICDLVKSQLKVKVTDESRLPNSIEMYNERFSTLLRFHSKNEMYVTKC